MHRTPKAEDLSTMISHYGPALMTFVGRIVTIQEDAEDVVQETFVAAYKHLDDYNPEQASMKTWLHRIAYHEALYLLRRRKRMAQIPLDVGEDIPDELPDATTAEELDEAIQKLTPEEQMLLQLYYFDQRPLKEIAYITGAADHSLNREVSRLSSQLHRIRQRLRMILMHMNDEAR
ncbi:MAG: sigma-70 family RNA polymerase sigma factor [Prevotella sp.]|nr:sigma-70 family RNA polymerase sigma factor [Prevotella sp.]